ncbi:SusC/RagA family TonB-linked outer membrane protein [Puteibacter caeruleilacunae]|nr:SusC/RagA family TonB-linked outer membrane protein [Puteibacter caeruleilacunae]
MKKNEFTDDLCRGRLHVILRVMKLTTIFILFGLISVAANTYSQSAKLSLKMKNVTLSQVFDQIEKQSEFNIFYKKGVIDETQKISMDFKDLSIEEVLKRLLDEKSINYMVIDRDIVLTKAKMIASNQEKKISGTVTDSDGEPLPGVSVVVEGTTVGITTDFDGKYSLNLPANASKVLFSFVGMKTQTVEVGSQSVINIVMVEDAIGMEEVVVVAYGTMKKENLTGAVDQVSSVELESRPIKDVGQGLKGIIPNLNITESSGAPNASASFNIRGFTGFDSNQNPSSGSPLILIDGVAQDINQINPEDVASISVLKDAASAAIYGSRAPHGVILVTTKSGKQGKMNISIASNVSFSEVVGLPDGVTSVEFAQAWNDAFLNARKGLYYSDETIQKMQEYIDGKRTDGAAIDPGAGRWGAYGDFQYGNTDWQKEAYRDWQVNQKHTISFSGGMKDNKLNYYASLGWSQNQGIMHKMLTDKYDRYNTTLKLTSQINEWLSLSLNNRYSRRVTNRPGYNPYNAANPGSDYYFTEFVGGRTWPVVPFYNPDGNMVYSNPVFRALAGGNYKDYIDDFWTTAAADLTPIKGLKIHGAYTWNIHSRDFTKVNKSITPITDWVDENGKHWYHEWKYAQHPNSVVQRFYKDTYHQIDLFATYDFNIENHNFSILAGYNEEEKKYKQLYALKKELITEDVGSISTAIGESPTVDDAMSEWATRGYFGRIKYNYKEKYLVEVNGRYDASSRFPENTRWDFFPSVSVGYNVAKEDFWNIDQVSTFKVRGSWGKLGNQNVSNYPYLPTMGITAKTGNVIGGSRVPAVRMPGLVSTDITWEKPSTIDVGFDLSAFNSRLNITYDWYQRRIADMIGKAEQLPTVLGTSAPKRNDAEAETRGWELSVGWKDQADLAGSPLNWSARVVVSDYIGYMTKYENKTVSWSGTWTKGERFGDIYGYEVEKVAQSSSDFTNAPSHHRLHSDYWFPGDLVYKDLDGNGMVDGGTSAWYNHGDLKVLGNTSPRYTYGITLSADWKGFDVRTNFEGVGKQDRWFSGLYYQGISGSMWSSTVMKHSMDYWRADNTDAFFPRPYMSSESGKKYKTNSRHITNAAYLRFKTLQLGYNIPKRTLKRIGLSKLRLYTTIENVGMIINKSHVKIDPLLILNGNGRTYPPQRTFSFGVNLTF